MPMHEGIEGGLGEPAPRRVGEQNVRPERVVAVIGAGFSGTMAAIHLRHALPVDHGIYLFDRTGRFARGPAYAQTDARNLLNVRSMNMSALPDDPGHFERWLTTQIDAWATDIGITEAGIFATRRLYGRYLRALLYREMTLSGGRVRLCADAVTGLSAKDGRWNLCCASGREVVVDAVVIAAGNLPSSRASDGVVCHDPWATGATSGLRQNEAVLIVGTGLTMVDLALGMHARGFNGPIVALSRRGLVPQPHTKPGQAWPGSKEITLENRSLVTLFRYVRGEIEKAARQDVCWRAVIDGLRPVTTSMWRSLTRDDRRRFLRHLRPFWDVHRHRMAPGVASGFLDLVNRGVLVLQRGRVMAIDGVDGPNGRCAHVKIQSHGETCTQTLCVQRVLYATGVGTGAAEDGLIAHLLASGAARTDGLGMGLDVTKGFEVIDRDGKTAHRLWALGPLVRGTFWECTSVPDIRIQARDISAQVAQQMAAGL